MGRKSLFRRSKMGCAAHRTYVKEKKPAKAKNTACGQSNDKARRPRRTLKAPASCPKPRLVIDRAKLDVVPTENTVGRRPPRRPWVTLIIDSYSRTVLGSFITEEGPEEGSETPPSTRSGKAPACRRQAVPALTARHSAPVSHPQAERTMPRNYKAMVERFFSTLTILPDDIPEPKALFQRRNLTGVEE